MTTPAQKRVNEILNDPSVRTFCKNIIRAGRMYNPVDALQDVELALKVLTQWCDEVADKAAEAAGY